MAARLRDVAEMAGVSVKTASNVINNYPHVKASTRARVEAAVRELRYRPNESARQLKHGRSGFLALAVPQLDSPYFAELATRLSAEAARQDFILLLDITGAEPTAERIVLDGVRSHVIDGVIFSPLTVSAAEVSGRGEDRPMVLLGERAIGADCDHVAVDSVAAAEAMTTHLVETGHTRIAAIGREAIKGTPSVRLQGYRRALKSAGLTYRPQLVVAVKEYTRPAGREAMKQLLQLDDPPDAVFCFNDLMAIGALRACIDEGVRVPSDVAIAGFDDIPECEYLSPTLTSVRADLDVLSREALRLLLVRVGGSTAAPERVRVPWTLQIRESTTGVEPA